MPTGWQCPACGRFFTRTNQRHACGTGDRREVLRNRPDTLVQLYESLEAFVLSLGAVEVVARKRYVLFRSVRIFCDAVIMTDAVRLAIHLGRRVDAPVFIKVVSDGKSVTHVMMLRTEQDLRVAKPYVKEAYDFSLSRRTSERSKRA